MPVFVIIAVVVILAGARAYATGKFSQEGRWPDVEGGTYASPVTKGGVKYLVPPDELYENGLGKDGFPALNTPAFLSVAAADDVLDDTVNGISVVVDGQARFYSYQILNWHEVVNDHFGNKDLLISYSPFCGAAVVYERSLDGNTRTFGDAGFVYNDCAILYDGTTDTLWNQATGVAIVGNEAGKVLPRYHSTVMTWADWKKAYPNGQALSTDTGFTRDYRRHPYGGYETSSAIFFPVNKTQNRVGAKDPVKDYIVDGRHMGVSVALASFMEDLSVNSGEEGATRLAVFVDGTDVHLFESFLDVDSRPLTFTKTGNVITDKETGSTWNTKGEAIKGEYKGQKLTELTSDARYFMFAYVSEYPDAVLAGADAFDAAQAANPTKPAGTDLNVGE